MRVQFSQSIDFNQMLVFSVSLHFAILTFVLFLPKPTLPPQVVMPAFMVNLVDFPSGNKLAVKKNKPSAKEKLVKKKDFKKEPASVAVKKSPPPKSSHILDALNNLDKKAAALPAKKMIEELDQLARLDRPQIPVAKPTEKKPVLEETFRELENLKSKKMKIEKAASPSPMAEDLLGNFEDLKMEEVIQNEKLGKEPDSTTEKLSNIIPPESIVEKRDLLKELEQLAKLDSDAPETRQNDKIVVPKTRNESGGNKIFDSILEKFESISVESLRVKVEVAEAKVDETKFQSGLRSIPESSGKNDPKMGDKSYVFSDREGEAGVKAKSLYVGMVQEKILKNWRDPLAEQHSKETVVSFYIFPQGNIDKPFIKQSSGVEILDTLAVRAVLDSVPFPQFPKELKMSNLLLSIYFKYVPKDD